MAAAGFLLPSIEVVAVASSLLPYAFPPPHPLAPEHMCLVKIRMGGKNNTSKGKGIESKDAAPSEEAWRKSKCTEADLRSLVDECLLQPKEIVHWHPAGKDPVPYECKEELVLFQHFDERGLALPTCDFIRGLLFHCGI